MTVDNLDREKDMRALLGELLAAADNDDVSGVTAVVLALSLEDVQYFALGVFGVLDDILDEETRRLIKVFAAP